jgi:hypothetical protein
MPTCLNCKQPIVEDAHFCHHCGAKVVRERLTLWGFFAQLGQTVFNTDSSIWRTIGHLSYAPGRVCRGYIEGVRKRYLRPVAYLFFVASLYGLTLLLSDGDIRYFHEDVALGFTSYDDATGLSEEERIRQLRPLALMFILLSIPILSLISRLIYRRAGFNLAEHLVINAYYMGQLLFLNLVLNLVKVLFPSLEENAFFYYLFMVVFLGYAWVLQVPAFQLRGVWTAISPLFFLLSMLFILGLFYGFGAEFLLLKAG